MMLWFQFLAGYILIVADTVLVMLSLGYLIEIRREWWAKAGLFIMCNLIVGMIIYIGDWDNLPLSLLGFLVAVWIFCRGSGWKKAAIGLMFASTIFSWNAVIDNYLMSYLDWTVPFRFLFAVLLFLGTRHFAPDKDYELSDAMWRLLILLMITPVGIVLSVILLSRPYWEDVFNSGLALALLLLAVFSFIGLLWTVTVFAKQKKLEQQNMFMEMNQKYYESMEQQHFEIRRLKHDLVNHLQVISALPEEEKEDYIQDMIANDAVMQTLNYCGDSTVNAVLAVKESLMRQQEIAFHRIIDIPDELPFEKPDICALFANALDNAIEACVREEVEKQEIILESRARKGLFAMQVKNPSGTQIEAGRFPYTSKKDAHCHGLGLKSIEEAVRRYEGQMEIRTEEGWFELFLYIPMKK